MSDKIKVLEQTKQQLEAMEYFDFLGVESLPLVTRILTDLVLTTESHEYHQKHAQSLEKELSKAQDNEYPIRRENERLLRENNQLHLKIIETDETADAREKKTHLQLQTMRDRLSKATFIASEWEKKYLSVVKGEIVEETISKDIHQLEDQLEAASRDRKQLEMSLENATDRILARDQEILRLGIELERKSPTASSDSTARLVEELEYLKTKLAQQDEELASNRLSTKLLEKARAESQKKEVELKHAFLQPTKAPAQADENKQPEVNRIENRMESARSDELGTLLESYATDRKRFASTMQSMEEQLVSASAQVQQLQQRLEEETAQGAKYQAKNSALELKCEDLKLELKQCQSALSRVHSERVNSEQNSANASEQVLSLQDVINEQDQDILSMRSFLEEERNAFTVSSKWFHTPNLSTIYRCNEMNYILRTNNLHCLNHRLQSILTNPDVLLALSQVSSRSATLCFEKSTGC